MVSSSAPVSGTGCGGWLDASSGTWTGASRGPCGAAPGARRPRVPQSPATQPEGARAPAATPRTPVQGIEPKGEDPFAHRTRARTDTHLRNRLRASPPRHSTSSERPPERCRPPTRSARTPSRQRPATQRLRATARVKDLAAARASRRATHAFAVMSPSTTPTLAPVPLRSASATARKRNLGDNFSRRPASRACEPHLGAPNRETQTPRVEPREQRSARRKLRRSILSTFPNRPHRNHTLERNPRHRITPHPPSRTPEAKRKFPTFFFKTLPNRAPERRKRCTTIQTDTYAEGGFTSAPHATENSSLRPRATPPTALAPHWFPIQIPSIMLAHEHPSHRTSRDAIMRKTAPKHPFFPMIFPDY